MKPILEHYELTREEIAAYLEERPPGVPTILASLTEQFMTRQGKQRWVEKSPEHLMHVTEIRERFSTSPIIRIIRDPRDTALSMVKWPNGPEGFLDALFYWREYDNASASFFEVDDNCHTIRYEDLVCFPERELEQVCSFLGEAYEASMLDTSQSASRVMTEKETWKQLVSKPVDRTRVGVWKRNLTRDQNRISEALIGDRITGYGYETKEEFEYTAIVYPSVDLLQQYPRTLRKFVDEGIRFWQDAHFDSDPVTILVGEPDKDRWLRYQKPERWWDTVRIVVTTLKHKLANRRVYWIDNPNRDSRPGYCSRMLSFILAFMTERRFETETDLN
jgi:hypothetical protein